MRIYFRSTSRILRVAKTHAKITGLPLQAAQNEVAYMLGYADLHELQRISAEGVHEPSPDDQDIALEEELQRRAYQAERLEEYRRAPGRTRLDAMTARAIVDDVRASARIQSPQGKWKFEDRFSLDEVNYGVVVRTSTTRIELAQKSDQLRRMDPDRIVLLSVSPHNVRQRIDWPEIELLFTSLTTHVVVEQVRELDIEHIAIDINVLI